MKNSIVLRCLFFSAISSIIQSSFAQSHVATTTKYISSSTSTISQAFSSASTAGNLIVVNLTWDNQSRSVSSVVDNKGNTYARINGPTNWNTGYRAELWYAYKIIGGGVPITITATLSGPSTSYFQIYMSEYSGISITDPLDQKSVSTGSSAAVSSGFKSTTVPNELIYGVSIGASGTLTAGSTFTVRSAANQNIVEDKIAVTTGSYNTKFTSAGGNWIAEMASFRPLIILPVELISFDVRVTTSNTVALDWITAKETNNNYFEVQRSRDGIDWKVLNKLKASDSSNTTIHYSTTDENPYQGLSWYRLLQVGPDGQTTYSKVLAIQIDLSSEKKIRIYPNPVYDHLTLENGSVGLQDISVVNYMGQAMNQKIPMIKENDSKIILELSSLPSGVYFLKTKDKSTPFYKQ